MKKTLLPNYLAIQKLLTGNRKDLSPAKIHGLMSGLLCAAKGQEIEWRALLGACQIQLPEMIFENLFSKTKNIFECVSAEISLLLPALKKPLGERAEALTLWCQGFISGFRLIVPEENRLALQGDAKEAMNDLLEIAKMKYEQVVASEEDEISYQELIRYVSVAVLVIYRREEYPVRLVSSQEFPQTKGVVS